MRKDMHAVIHTCGYLKVLTISSLLIFSCTKGTDEQVSGDTERKQLPNIILFYADDLGYGDLGCYGAIGVTTPNLDALAAQGIQFTDAYSTAATCTPSRYSLLTGRYAFRNNAAILPGDAPLLIQPGTPTLPAMLKEAGYKTGVVGKWHLGLGRGDIDWNGVVKPGPLEVGFDYSFLLPATGDRVPAVFVENHRVVNLDPHEDPIVVDYQKKLPGYPNGLDSPELVRQKADKQHSNTIVNGVSRIGYMKGGKSALWVDEEFPDVFVKKAKAFIADAKDRPFFLFFSFHDIHVPRLPNKRFVGKSTMGPRGDAIIQMDWTVGAVLKELEQRGIKDKTLIIFTSDNGPVLNDGYEDAAVEMLGDHNPGGPFRGGKYSAYEAGTRVPTIINWPGVSGHGKSKAVISQVDLYASLASLTGYELAEDEAIDSKNILGALLDPEGEGREFLIEESFTTSIRHGKWKYIEPFSKSKHLPTWMASKGVEGGFEFFPQLFDLDRDIGEQVNLAEELPEIVQALQSKIDSVRAGTRRVPAL